MMYVYRNNNGAVETKEYERMSCIKVRKLGRKKKNVQISEQRGDQKASSTFQAMYGIW